MTAKMAIGKSRRAFAYNVPLVWGKTGWIIYMGIQSVQKHTIIVQLLTCYYLISLIVMGCESRTLCSTDPAGTLDQASIVDSSGSIPQSPDLPSVV